MKLTTTTYNYNNNEQEYVLCYRSRPFAVLSSSFFPTPTSSFIDHHLVMELGMKMTDIGCKKFSFCGKKLRMLGKVSFTAQCVQDGRVFGNFHFKASVVEDLKHHFDSHAIAGSKMTSFLTGECSDTSSVSSTPSKASPTPSPPTTSQARPSAPPHGHARPPATPHGHARPSAPTSPAPGTPSPISPPGFPSRPLHPPPPDAPHLNNPILFSNLIMLNQMFNGADNRDNVDDERRMLEYIDEEGIEDVNQPKFTYRMSDNSWYQTGHGRTKCRHYVCSRSSNVPDNCGFAADTWQFPINFRPCSNHCRGGFCSCINNYDCN